MPVEQIGQVAGNPEIRFEEALAPKWAQMGHMESVVARGYSLVKQLTSQEEYQLVLTKYIPQQLVEKYRRAAMKKVLQKKLEDDTWYAEIEIPGFEGVWASEETLRDCLNVLDEVLLDWLLLKIESEDKDIPVVEHIDLNAL